MPAPKDVDSAGILERETTTEFWFPRKKIRFVLLLCVAVVLIYLVGEVTRAWGSTLLALTTLLTLNFAQTKPEFQPFPWWALIILPLAAATSSIMGVPACGRAPITSISFGVALLCSAVARPFSAMS